MLPAFRRMPATSTPVAPVDRTHTFRPHKRAALLTATREPSRGSFSCQPVRGKPRTRRHWGPPPLTGRGSIAKPPVRVNSQPLRLARGDLPAPANLPGGQFRPVVTIGSVSLQSAGTASREVPANTKGIKSRQPCSASGGSGAGLGYRTAVPYGPDETYTWEGNTSDKRHVE